MEHANLAYIDLETTGLSAWKCGITQIGYILEIVEPGETTGTVVLENVLKPNIFPGTQISPEALEKTGMTMEMIQRGMEPRDALDKLLNDIRTTFNGERCTLVGYNANFDDQFLRQFFKACKGPAYWKIFQTPCIDVMSIAANQMRFIRDELKEFGVKHGIKGSFKLELVAKALGLEATGSLHDAIVDIRLTRDIYNTLNKEVSWKADEH